MTNYKTFLRKLDKNLQILQEREAKYAGNAPVELINQIADHHTAIDLTKQADSGQLSEAAWREAITPLLVAIKERTSEAAQVTIGDVTGGITGSIIAGRDVIGSVINVVYQRTPPRPIDPDELAEAQRNLANLPLDAIPNPAPLPPGSRMRLRRNPLFVGRETDLKALAKALKGGETAAIGQIAAATGLGGIGKTQLAREFVHRYGQFFAGGVFWLSFADPANVRAEIADCSGLDRLNLSPEFEVRDLETQVRLVLSAWQSKLPRLLIFDNCEDEALLDEWQPPTGGCRVLVTSRRNSWSPELGVRGLVLGTLSREESVALLQRHRPDLASAELDPIAAELGDLPLALHLAGSYLKRYRHVVSPDAYLTELRDLAILTHSSLQGRGVIGRRQDHDPHVGRTFELSYKRLDTNDPSDQMALALLRRAACLAPGEPIPRSLLLMTLELSERDLDAILRVEDSLARLVELGLLEEVAEGALLLHRLMAVFVTQLLPDMTAQEAVETAIIQKLLQAYDQISYDKSALQILPHLLMVTEAASQREDEHAARLCNQLGHFLTEIDDTKAQDYLKQALAIGEKVLGPEHEFTIDCLNNLGFLFLIKSRKKSFFHNLLAKNTSISENLSFLFLIKSRKKSFFHNFLAKNTSKNVKLLIDASRKKEDYARSRYYLERALTTGEKILEANHLHIATSLHHLGKLCINYGDDVQARYHLERALVIMEKTLGNEHPKTLLCMNNLGVAFLTIDYARSRYYLERALAIGEKVLDPEHLSTGPILSTILGNLGSLRYVVVERKAPLDRVNDAYILDRTLAIIEEGLKADKLYTFDTFKELSLLIYEQWVNTQAQQYLERALTIREKLYGPEHRDTISSLFNLVDLFYEQGEYAQAEECLDRNLSLIQENSPIFRVQDTFYGLYDLGHLLYEMGDFARARSYFELASDSTKMAFDPDSYETQLIRRKLSELDRVDRSFLHRQWHRRRKLSKPDKVAKGFIRRQWHSFIEKSKILDNLDDSHHKITDLINYEPKVGVLGKADAGKSSLSNAIFGRDTFEVSDVLIGTTKPQKIFFTLGERGIKLIDFPGVGEDVWRDEALVKFYQELLPELDLVLWLIKADDTALATEERFYNTIVRPKIGENTPFVVVISQTDKMEPFGEWDKEKKRPGPKQSENIDLKVEAVTSLFDIPSLKVIPTSAIEYYNLIELVDKIVELLPSEKKYALVREVREEFVSQAAKQIAQSELIQIAQSELIRKMFEGVGEGGGQIAWKTLRGKVRDKVFSKAMEIILRQAMSSDN